MTTCKTILPRLTAYLDGELTDERGSVVRGHLRECAECRQIARDEAVLRDGLRELAPVDPPASLWAGVQAKLAAAEVADARKPPWRRALARWARWTPVLPRFAAGGALAMATVAVVLWRAPGPGIDEPPARSDGPKHIAAGPPDGESPREDSAQQVSGAAGDVTEDLLAEPAQTTASYGLVIEELMKLASDAHSSWSGARIAAFEAKVTALRADIASAGQDRAQQRAQRALIRYLQGEVVRDDTLLAGGGMP